MNKTAKISLEDIGESLAKYRIVDPSAENRMFESMKEMGQLSPIIVAEAHHEPMELLDGFKRLHAARKLPEMNSLYAHTLPVQGYAQKALILKLNWKGGHLRILEEAAIIQSLHRDDGLEQLAIAKLLGRHPSWVCRRLSLVEHLHEEVKSHIDVGLIPASFGRELAKLPRGNQEEVLKCLVKHCFSRKETEKLVRHLLKTPRWSWSKILYYPWDLIHREDLERPPKTPSLSKKGVASDFANKLSALEALCSEVLRLLEQNPHVPDVYLTRIRHSIKCIAHRVEFILTQREKEQSCLPF
jgi:ParB-like chromosome segregation protein Spo0J